MFSFFDNDDNPNILLMEPNNSMNGEELDNDFYNIINNYAEQALGNPHDILNEINIPYTNH